MYGNDTESIEPPNNGISSLQNIKGLDAKKQKDKNFGEAMEEMHSAFCDAPIVTRKYFSLKMRMDVTIKGIGRINMDKIRVFEVEDGKIVKEQFFY